MKTRACAVLGCTAVLASTLAAAPTGASTADVYRGTYGGTTLYEPKSPGDPACDVTAKSVTGTWSIRKVGDSVTATTNLFYDGRHHLAWGGNALDRWEVLPTPTGARLAMTTDIFGSGNSVTMTVWDDDTMTYVVEPYDLYGHDCQSLTLTGDVLFDNQP